MSKDAIQLDVKWNGDNFKYTGFDDADALSKAADAMIKEFAAHDKKKTKAAVRKATRAACKEIVLPDAKRHVPEDSGDLLRSLKVRALPRSRKRQGHGVVGGSKADAPGMPFYAIFQEFGWRPRNQHTGTGDREGGQYESGTMHPNAQPFLRPALWVNASRIFQKVASVTRREMFK